METEQEKAKRQEGGREGMQVRVETKHPERRTGRGRGRQRTVTQDSLVCCQGQGAGLVGICSLHFSLKAPGVCVGRRGEDRREKLRDALPTPTAPAAVTEFSATQEAAQGGLGEEGQASAEMSHVPFGSP